MKEYSTVGGDTFDLVAHRNYGKQEGVVEALMDANPNLLQYRGVFPQGTIMKLPDLPETSLPPSTVRLWEYLETE